MAGFGRYAPQYVRRLASVGTIQSHIIIPLRRVFIAMLQDVWAVGTRDKVSLVGQYGELSQLRLGQRTFGVPIAVAQRCSWGMTPA